MAAVEKPHPTTPNLRPMTASPSPLEAAQAIFSELQQRALAACVTLRQPPSPPTTCCGRGCNGCVWEGFYAAVDYWREEALLQLTP